MCLNEAIISLSCSILNPNLSSKYAEHGVTSYDIGTGFGHFAIATQDVGEADQEPSSSWFLVFISFPAN